MLGFKIMDDPFVGTITFCRVYSGKLESGTTVLNSTKDKKERVGRMLLMHANNREDIKEAYRRRHRRAGRPQGYPHRRHAVRPAEAGHPGEDGIPRAGDRDRDRAEVQGRPGKAGRRAGQARRRRSVLPRLDRSGIGPDHHQGHGRTASRHQGRHPAPHLQGRRQYRRAAGRLSREADQARPRSTTPTRSRPAAPASSPRSRSCSSRPSRARARRSKSKIVGGSVPKEYIPGVEKGINSVMGTGVLAGFPVVDVKATLIDGAYHDVNSSALAFEIASRAAFREALQKGGSVLLEPIMKVEVVTPEEHTGFVIGDLLVPSRPGAGPGHARQRRRHQCDGAARQHVRLRQHSCARAPRGARTSRCSSTTTSRCRRTSPRKSKRNTSKRSADASIIRKT